MSTDELVMMTEAVLMAGTDTTRNQLACAVALLAEHPDQWVQLAADPELAPRAVEAGFRSMLSVSLTGPQGGTRAALNLYSAAADAFDATAIVTAGLFAGQAAALLYGADHAHDLGVALASRDVIGQAKGILVERFGVGPEQAFAMLVESSQHTNMKLVDVATWLVGEAQKDRGAQARGR